MLLLLGFFVWSDSCICCCIWQFSDGSGWLATNPKRYKGSSKALLAWAENMCQINCGTLLKQRHGKGKRMDSHCELRFWPGYLSICGSVFSDALIWNSWQGFDVKMIRQKDSKKSIKHRPNSKNIPTEEQMAPSCANPLRWSHPCERHRQKRLSCIAWASKKWDNKKVEKSKQKG